MREIQREKEERVSNTDTKRGRNKRDGEKIEKGKGKGKRRKKTFICLKNSYVKDIAL